MVRGNGSRALLFGLGAADTRKPGASLLMLLALAPMVPVVGVTLAYGPGSDPAHEATIATAMSGLRLVLLRSTAVVACSIGAASIATLLLRDKTWMSIAWLVPSLALPAVCLALSTYVTPRRAAVVVGVFWLVPLSIVNRNVTDELVVFRQWGQLALIVVGAVAACTIAFRRDAFDRLVVVWSASVMVLDATKRFDSRTALAGVSLSASRGVTTILGPNGAGKTSLLRALATVQPLDAGRIVIDGLDATNRHQRVEIRRRLGYLPQDIGFSTRATAFDVVDYLAVLKGWRDPRRGAAKCGSRSIESDCRRGPPTAWARSAEASGNVSGSRRPSSATPPLIVLDEPSTGFDPAQRLELRTVLSELARRSTIVVSTHQTDDAAVCSDVVFVLDGGELRFSGTPAQLADLARGCTWRGRQRRAASGPGGSCPPVTIAASARPRRARSSTNPRSRTVTCCSSSANSRFGAARRAPAGRR